MLEIFIFFIIICISYANVPSRNNDFKENVVTKIFEVKSVTTYFECVSDSIIFNTAENLKIPVPGTPPQPIDERNVSFKIYTSRNSAPYTVNTFDSTKSVINLPIDIKVDETIVYVNGLHLSYVEFVKRFKNASFPKKNMNLIFLDWDSYNDYNSMYSRGITVPRLSKILAKFLRQYIRAGANPKNIHLIGESSGAQVLGGAGKLIEPKIGRITGLDPVGACYNFGYDSIRLSQGDADFVEIVHCSIGEFGELSKFKGDATFYMNGGKVQPQCLDEENLTLVNLCSHVACPEYFFQTLKDPNKYIGVNCDMQANCDCNDKAVMGYYTPTNTKGSYYVNTKPGSQQVCKK